MKNGKHPAPQVEVEDPASAIERARELGRKILLVPKSAANRPREKSAKRSKRS